MMPLFLSLFLFLLGPSFAYNIKFIHDASELIKFSNDVNSGTSYEGYTVYLAADIDFSGFSSQFKPIGYYKSSSDYNFFQGTFDGQGYAISNLVMSSSSFNYLGLFGVSWGATFKNIVLDNSCSFTNSYSTTVVSIYTGGIIGFCYSVNKLCAIENSVNMADITLKAYLTDSTNLGLMLGGIAGCLSVSDDYTIVLNNCVNYGTITDTSYTNKWSDIGGIVGLSGGFNIQNCYNYGTILFGGTATIQLNMGGISGNGDANTFVNCVNAGKITKTGSSNDVNIGNIDGLVHSFSYVTFTHCYWTSGTNCNNLYGGKSDAKITKDDSSSITLSSVSVDDLNKYATDNTWNNWTFNQNKAK